MVAGFDQRASGAVGGLILGGASGMLWGIVARIWMRLISDRPEFSWGGTLWIVVAFACLGGLAGWTRAARRAGGQGWRLGALRIIAFLAVVPLATGAGAFLVVGVVVPGALALGQRRWWPAARLLLALFAALATATISYLFVREKSMLLAPVSVPLFLLIGWVLVAWVRASLDPVPRWRGESGDSTELPSRGAGPCVTLLSPPTDR
jgi:hypothetical protein